MNNQKKRSDKKIRVNVSLDQHTHEKLKRLSLACGAGSITKTTLAAELINFCLNHADIINYFQYNRYHQQNIWKVTPIKVGKEVHFQD